MPTGGVNTKNLMDYLGYDCIFACGGTWMVKKDLIEGEKWDEITRICKDAVKTMLGFELGHVGINCRTPARRSRPPRPCVPSSALSTRPATPPTSAGSAVECNKAPGRGAHGHIAIRTNNVDRAIYHLGLQGVKFRRVQPQDRRQGPHQGHLSPGGAGRLPPCIWCRSDRPARRAPSYTHIHSGGIKSWQSRYLRRADDPAPALQLRALRPGRSPGVLLRRR
ncbi:MAG: hypothetical protein ACLR0P_06335 [Oscillospiraceae bacterium]